MQRRINGHKCVITHLWNVMNLCFSSYTVQLTRMSISRGKWKITVRTLLLPLSCPLVFRQLWFVVIYHGGPSDTDKVLPLNEKLLFVSVCDCRGAPLPPNAAVLIADKLTMFGLILLWSFEHLTSTKVCNTRCRPVCTIYIYYTHTVYSCSSFH